MAPKNVSEVTCKARFGAIKEDLIEIKTTLNRIETNDLRHIHKAITKMDTKQKIIFGILGALGTAVIALVSNLIYQFIIKSIGG